MSALASIRRSIGFGQATPVKTADAVQHERQGPHSPSSPRSPNAGSSPDSHSGRHKHSKGHSSGHGKKAMVKHDLFSASTSSFHDRQGSSSSPSSQGVSTSALSGKPAALDPSSPPVLAYLILENSHGQDKVAYPIRKYITKIGRLPTNDIRIYRETVSRVHCQIAIDMATRKEATLQVFNPRGVKVNGTEVDVSKHATRVFRLVEGDKLEIYRNFFRMQFPSVDATADQSDEANGQTDENANPNARGHSRPRSPRKSLRMSLLRASVIEDSIESNKDEKQARRRSSTLDTGRMPLQPLQPADVSQQREENEQTGREQDGAQASSSLSFLKEETPARKLAKKGRRSLVFATPKRDTQKLAPWTVGPKRSKSFTMDKGFDRAESSTQSSSTASSAQYHYEESVVVLEEMEEDDDEMAPPETEKGSSVLEQKEDVVEAEIQNPTEAETPPLTPQRTQETNDQGDERLTKSSSPVKKVRRRSSLFGRIGNWGFGFGADANANEKNDADNGAEAVGEDELALVTSPNGTRHLPEPRLDDSGRPRLPRSLSSPDGSHSPKRRSVSLRTATLLRQGQHAYEQQKLRSPPPSPTKATARNVAAGSPVSLMDAMRRMMSSSPPPPQPTFSDLHSTTSDSDVPSSTENDSNSKSVDVDLLAPKSVHDAEDEDEVDRSLCMADDEDDEQEEEEETKEAVEEVQKKSDQAIKALRKPRRSESVAMRQRHNADTASHQRKKSRTSMPAKLVSISVVEGNAMDDLEDLKAQWIAGQLSSINDCSTDAIEKVATDDVELEQDLKEEDHSDTDSEFEDIAPVYHPDIASAEPAENVEDMVESSYGNQSTDQPSSSQQESVLSLPLSPSGVKYGMLRYLVRENADLSALLDSVEDVSNLAEVESDQQSISDMLMTTNEEGLSDPRDELVVEAEASQKNEWVVVSPKRKQVRWEATDRKMTNARRASEGRQGSKENAGSDNESRRKLKRRTTAAPALASAPVVASRMPIADDTNIAEAQEVKEERPESEAVLPVEVTETAETSAVAAPAGPTSPHGPEHVARSPSKRVASPAHFAKEEESSTSKATSGSPSKRTRRRSPDAEQSPQEIDAVKPFLRTPRAAKVAAQSAIAQSSSPDKSKRSTTASAPDVVASSPTKQLKAKPSKAPVRSSKRVQAETSPQKQPLSPVSSNRILSSIEDGGADESTAAFVPPSSSPSKRARRGRKAPLVPAQEEDDKENVDNQASPSKAPATSSRPTGRKRGPTSKAAKAPVSEASAGASTTDSAPAVSQRTTRSGRAVRKPADLHGPATITQSDPVVVEGRTTRSTRSKK